jgi:GTP-binding protein
MATQVLTAEFEALAVDPTSWPAEGAPEIAFAGRSNVGKSSLINALVQRRKLARTSTTPGRTRGLVFFRVEPAGGPSLRFVDLPGYGHAQVAKSERAAWRPMVEAYIERRQALALVVVLVDVRRGLAGADRELVEWLASLQRAFVVVMTKLDKLPRTGRLAALAAAERELGRKPLGVSVTEGLGTDELWRLVLARAAAPR